MWSLPFFREGFFYWYMVYGIWCMVYGVWCIVSLSTIHYTPYTIHLFVSQNFQHALCSLFFCIQPVYELPVFVIIYGHMFGRRDQAMFYAAIPADLILVSTGMKKS